MRQIDADALTEKYGDWYVEEGSEEGFIGTIKQLIDAQPTIKPERKTGRWIPCPQNASWLYVYKCSECGGYLQISDVDGKGYKANYCSCCGAKMEREESR